jgi:ribonuclease J
MRVRIHRGTKQIGGTCVEIASGGDSIVLDFGLPLDGDASDVALVPQILGNHLRGVVISHPHLDHYGLLHHLPEGVSILIGDAARRIVRAAAPFTKQDMPRLEGPTLEHRKTIELGVFRITPYLVDHSAFDAYSLLIEANGKRLFYSGDFRAHGRKSALFEQMVLHPPKDIDVLLMEGSSLSRLDDEASFPTEQVMENQLVETLKATAGLAMVHTSAQNIDRIVSLYRACKKTDRTMVIDLYAAAILEATGNDNIPQSSWPGVALYVPESQRRLIKKNEWFELLDKHKKNRIFADRLHQEPSKYVMLFRPLLMRDLNKAGCLDGASFIYSQWEGYLEKGSYADMEAWLESHSISMTHIHTSGHASPVDLKRFAEALAPKVLVPIHSFAPEKYEGLFSNVISRDDGEWWEVEKNTSELN